MDKVESSDSESEAEVKLELTAAATTAALSESPDSDAECPSAAAHQVEIPSRTWACPIQWHLLEKKLPEYKDLRARGRLSSAFWTEQTKMCASILEDPSIDPVLLKPAKGGDAIRPTETQIKNWFRNRPASRGRHYTEISDLLNHLSKSAQPTVTQFSTPRLMNTYQHMHKDKISRAVKKRMSVLPKEERHTRFIEFNASVRAELYASEPPDIKAAVEAQYRNDVAESDETNDSDSPTHTPMPGSYGHYVQAVPQVLGQILETMHRTTGLVFGVVMGGVMSSSGAVETTWLHVGTDKNGDDFGKHEILQDVETAFRAFTSDTISAGKRKSIRRKWSKDWRLKQRNDSLDDPAIVEPTTDTEEALNPPVNATKAKKPRESPSHTTIFPIREDQPATQIARTSRRLKRPKASLDTKPHAVGTHVQPPQLLSPRGSGMSANSPICCDDDLDEIEVTDVGDRQGQRKRKLPSSTTITFAMQISTDKDGCIHVKEVGQEPPLKRIKLDS